MGAAGRRPRGQIGNESEWDSSALDVVGVSGFMESRLSVLDGISDLTESRLTAPDDMVGVSGFAESRATSIV